MSDHVLHCPPGYSSTDLFARGNSGFLYRKPHGCRVVKYPPSYAFADLRNEYNIYTRLAENGGSDRITQCFGMVERGIELEFLEGGCLTSVLKGLQYDDEDLETRLLWVSQCIEAIRHAHSKNIHCYDVSSNNFVLDGQKNVKAIDFEDAEIMGEIPLTGFCHAGHSCPPFNEKIRRDVFLLGVIIYQVMTGSLPYQDDDQPTWKQIKRRYEKGEFSSTSSLPGIGDIIAQCWEGRYQCVEQIETDIEHEKGTTSQTWKIIHH